MTMEDQNNLEEKKRAARLAMAGEVFFNKEKMKAEDLAEKRRQAQLAMESAQHKARRQEQERLIRQREEGRRLIAEEKARRAEQQAKQQAEQAKRDAQEKARRELENLRRREKFQAKQNLIEDLKNNTTAGLSPIRTLGNDLAHLVNQDALSIDQTPPKPIGKKIIYRQGGETKPNTKNGRKLVVVITLIIVPIIVASLVAFYLNQKNKTEEATIIPTSHALIFSEKNLSFDIAGKPSLIIFNTINTLVSLGNTANTITNLQMYVSATTSAGQVETANVNLSEFLSKTRLPLPPDLTRYLGEKFMIGFYQGATGPKVFLIFSVNETDYAKSWILKNEMFLLATVLGPFHTDRDFLNQIQGQKIIDVTIKNKDARLVKNKVNETIALYSWLDEKTLLVAQDEASFTKIIDAFNTPAPLN